MSKYLIRTDREENKTQILKLENPIERIGLIYTDFILRSETRDITKEEIIDPETNKSIGQIRLFGKNDLIAVRLRGKDIVLIERNGIYKEDEEEIDLKRYDVKDLTSERYDRLKAMGLDHVYSLGNKSQLSCVYCFEKDNSLASVVIGRDESNGIETALKGLTLSIAKRIANQDYVFEILR